MPDRVGLLPTSDQPVLLAAPRDHTAYMRSRGGRGYKLHVIVGDYVSGCGRLIVHEAAQDAAGVEPHQRCRRRGCRERWPNG